MIFSEPNLDYFTTVIHHGGHFVYNPNIRYTDRRVSYFDFFHVDAISMIEVTDMINELRFEGRMRCFRKSSRGALSKDVVMALASDFDVSIW